MKLLLLTVLLLSPLFAHTATSGEVHIVDAKASPGGGGNSFSFSVTLRHDDTGWEHYADAWEVLAPDGTILGKRVLLHPHENEQPFTRSLSGVVIPNGTGWINIRAHDKVHGYGTELFRIDLPGR